MYDASKEIFHASSLDSTAIKKKTRHESRTTTRDLSSFVHHNWAYIRRDNGCHSITCNNLITVLIGGGGNIGIYSRTIQFIVIENWSQNRAMISRIGQSEYRTNFASPFVCRNNSIKSTMIEEQRVHASFSSHQFSLLFSFSLSLSLLLFSRVENNDAFALFRCVSLLK